MFGTYKRDYDLSDFIILIILVTVSVFTKKLVMCYTYTTGATPIKALKC